MLYDFCVNRISYSKTGIYHIPAAVPDKAFQSLKKYWTVEPDLHKGGYLAHKTIVQNIVLESLIYRNFDDSWMPYSLDITQTFFELKPTNLSIEECISRMEDFFQDRPLKVNYYPESNTFSIAPEELLALENLFK